MDDYSGRVLADRYRLPLPPSDEYELAQTHAFDTHSGQEVLVRQVPLPEVVEAEVLDADGLPEGFTGRAGIPGARRAGSRVMESSATRTPSEPSVRRAIEAAQAAAQIPDHPRLDQVFDVFAEGGSLWVVSEAVAARPLAALLAESPLSPYRAAEVAADVLTALRALHAHGWVHRNITARTVLVCDDGRVLLTGLAAGAAEEALCGYDPTPEASAAPALTAPVVEPPDAPAADGPDTDTGSQPSASSAPSPAPAGPYPGAQATDARAARAGAIAAYRAGARAAARVQEEQEASRWAQLSGADAPRSLPPAQGDESGAGGARPPGQIADPYGVQRTPPLLPGQAAPPTSAVHPDPAEQGHGTGSEALRPASGVAPASSGVSWDEVAGWTRPAEGAPRRGPATPLAADRARQARMAVVGPVTERWAPEQAGPVHENWQLAPPIGPATDLWALGALLFRAVQGHAPYPEESTPELVEMVCSEPPAFAEECGPLRPIVESLLRQDPAERPDFEEVRGWLRSLVRSAPEPDAGAHVVATPPADAERLPIIRRRGELVRRRKGILATTGGRHKRDKETRPRRLGRTLLTVVLLGLAAAVAYAMLYMPKSATGDQEAATGGGASPSPRPSAEPGAAGGGSQEQGGDDKPSRTPTSRKPQTTAPGLPDGFTLRTDTEGFRIAVATGWHRQARNPVGQVVYSKDGFQLIVVPGRDTAASAGSDPMVYQRDKEHELQPYRDSSWTTSDDLRTTQVGDRVMAEGTFTWQGDAGEVYVRNLALLVGGRYHVVQVRGPETQRDKVDALYEQASKTYQYTG